MSLLWSAEKNEEILKSDKLTEDQKRKIRDIQNYKNYFYDYWDKDSTKIYSKTTILESDAVTYLVITSPHNKISAQKTCFPIMGCFPYLGFYNLESAKKYAREQKKAQNVVYVRPVYAYSTLGYFTDTILSSFFHFDDYELSELIFHELFHTIFFIKDEVDLNESLANYFGKEMAIEYFKLDEKAKKDLELKRENQVRVSLEIVKFAKELNNLYEIKQPKTKAESEKILKRYEDRTFIPRMKELCKELSIKGCPAIERSWNNASLAAFLTYESDSNRIEELRKRKGLDLRSFFEFIEKKHEVYKTKDLDEPFSKYLFQN